MPLLTIFFSFFIGWIWMGYGVAWYGLPVIFILYFLCFLALSEFLETFKKYPVGYKFLINFCGVIFSVTVLLHLIFGRLAHAPSNHFYTSFSWAAFPSLTTADKISDVFFPAEKKAAGFINADTSGNILRIGTMIRFWLDEADDRIIEDPQLDLFQRFSVRGYAGTLHQLRQNNIKFIVIDRGTVSIEKDVGGTLHQKFSVLENFIKEGERRGDLEALVVGEHLVLVNIISPQTQ